MNIASFVQPYYKKFETIIKGSRMNDEVVLRPEPMLIDENDATATIEVGIFFFTFYYWKSLE